jgi:diacylglycerol kinase (ATP)
MKLLDFLSRMPKLYTGKVIKIPEVHYSKNAWVEVKPKDPSVDVPVEMDGETVGTLPARFEILPKRVRFVVG